MTKAKISEYDASAGSNTDVNGVNIAEGCAPSGINNAIREVMAALKRFETGSDGDSVTVGGSLVVSGSTTANTLSATVFQIDTISEKTSAAGVTVDGVLLKDNQVSTDQINEKTSAAGVTIDGVLLKDSEVTTDVIKEKTSATGVTIDSVLLKDGMVVTDSSMNFRNRIINGDMRIDQRNAGAAVTADNAFPVDRFQIGNSTDGAFSAQRDSSAPTGFVNSVKVTTTTADGTLTTTQVLQFRQSIEGTNVADLGWGTANAKTVTLSFWVRSSLTGTFGGALRNSAANRSYPFTYSISVADTWEYKTVTVAGDTTGTWLTTTGVGIQVTFGLGVGPDRSGTAGSWAGATYVSATGAVSVIGTLNATWYITGVQLEVGSVATPFERRPYGTELSLCQRYLPAWTWESGNDMVGNGYSVASTSTLINVPIFVTPRVKPTGITTSAMTNFVLRNGGNVGGTPTAIAGNVFSSGPSQGITVTTTAGSPTLTIGQGSFLFASGAAQILFTGCEL